MNTEYKNATALYAKSVYDTATQYYVEALKPGTVQNVVQATLRTMVGITSIHYNPMAALAGATVALVKPGLAKQVISVTDGAINGLWNRMSINVKVGLAVGGIAAASVYDPTLVFTGLGTFFAVKLGAELAIRNLGKEEIALKIRELEKATEIQ